MREWSLANESLSEDERKKRLVAVAKDVLAHIATSKLDIRKGVYVEWPSSIDYTEEPDNGAAFQQIVNDALDVERTGDSCQVCAKGAAFLSYVKLYDNICPLQVGDCNDRVSDTMEDIFGTARMSLIEHCFEMWDSESGQSALFRDGDGLDDIADEWIYAAQERSLTAEQRVVKIMETIIAEGGTFLGV